ncbi:MAG: ribonuclease HII [Chloroflexota bacterium]
MVVGGREPEAGSPSLRFERALWAAGLEWIVGIDEAGLGSLCGPVVAAAVCVVRAGKIVAGVRDSKLLSSQRREALRREIIDTAAAVGIGAASVGEIERLNVRSASHLAMKRALARVGQCDHALIDGRPIKRDDLGPHTTIVDGDALSYSIACASIVAKVTRDRLMKKLAARYPSYGWDHNAGYGTGEHLAALGRSGLTPYHRLGFRPVRALLLQEGEGVDRRSVEP